METIIIGKPAMNTYLPLPEFPKEGDVFALKNKIESVGNVGATSACLLAKWGISTHFCGVLGNDGYADKIRETFNTYRVNTKYLEVDFEHSTSVNYIILNTKNGVVSKILTDDPAVCLQRFKYDFIPDWAIIDGTDMAGTIALMNNNASVKKVFYAKYGDKDSIAISKRCTWVICTQIFAEMMTHETCDGSAESYVNLYQKIVDVAGTGNYIVILNNHKILYTENGQVKMLPEMKMNAIDYSSFDSIFVGAFTFAISNNVEINNAIKFANMAAALSITKIGEATSLPDIDEVIDNAGLRDKLNLPNYKKPEYASVKDIINGNATNEVVEENKITDEPTRVVPMQQPEQVHESNMFDMPTPDENAQNNG